MSYRRCLDVGDFRRAARRALPSAIFGYLDGGADDEWSLRDSTAAFEKYALMPEYLRDISSIDTKATILGVEVAAPVILSPTGIPRLFHHDRDTGVAKPAGEAGLLYTLSTLGTASIEEIAAVNSGPKMFQIYIHKDRGLTSDLVARCKAAGYAALCLTVDAAVAGNRQRDLKSGFVMPPHLTWKSFASFAMHPGWTANLLLHPGFALANVSGERAGMDRRPLGVIEYVNTQFDRTVTWDDAERLVREWGGPFAIKGLQSVHDARRAADIGATAIMISNHGGRQLDGAPAPIDCVRPIRDAVGDSIELIVDGGVRRGAHVLKALALGADAVSFGRPQLYALAAGGEGGVRRFLQLFLDELRRGLALIGCARIGDVGERHVMMRS